MRDFEKANQSLSDCLKIQKKCLGSTSLEITKTLEGMARTSTELHYYADAEVFLEDSLRIRKLHLSEDHKDVTDTIDFLHRTQKFSSDHASHV